MKTINQWLKEKRKTRRMSKEELAEKLNLSTSVIEDWENGTIEIPMEMLGPICLILKTDSEIPLNILNKMNEYKWMLKNILTSKEQIKSLNEFAEALLNNSSEILNLIKEEYKYNILQIFSMRDVLCEILDEIDRDFMLKQLATYLYEGESEETIVNSHLLYTATARMYKTEDFEHAIYWDMQDLQFNDYYNKMPVLFPINYTNLFKLDIPDMLDEYDNWENNLEENINKIFDFKLTLEDMKILIISLWNSNEDFQFDNIETMSEFFLKNSNNSFADLIAKYPNELNIDEKVKYILNIENLKNINIEETEKTEIEKRLSIFDENMYILQCAIQILLMRMSITVFTDEDFDFDEEDEDFFPDFED